MPSMPTAIAPPHLGNAVTVKTRKKLIEVALPLEKINVASAREKSIRHGHPSTLHLWWARRPLAAARAVIFSQMVDDPSEYVDELVADPATQQKAEHELAVRRTAWLEKRAHQAEAAAAGDVQDPDPGPEPSLQGCAADLERERLSASSSSSSPGRTRPTSRSSSRPAQSCAAVGTGPAPTTPIIPAPPSCSTHSACPPSTTRSPAAARCRWRRSAWGLRPTPAT